MANKIETAATMATLWLAPELTGLQDDNGSCYPVILSNFRTLRVTVPASSCVLLRSLMSKVYGLWVVGQAHIGIDISISCAFSGSL